MINSKIQTKSMSSSLWISHVSSIVVYFSMQLLMLKVFGGSYCAHKSFMGCVLPIVYLIPLSITLVIFAPVIYLFYKSSENGGSDEKINNHNIDIDFNWMQ